MTDYSMAIYGLVFVTVVITAGVVFVLRQPSDLPAFKKQRD